MRPIISSEIHLDPIPAAAHQALDQHFITLCGQYPALNDRLNDLVADEYTRQVAYIRTAAGRHGESMPDEAADTLLQGMKRLTGLFADPEHPEDMVHPEAVYMLLVNLNAARCHISELPDAVDAYTHLASNLYLPMLQRGSAAWELTNRHDQFLMAHGAALNDLRQTRSIPRQLTVPESVHAAFNASFKKAFVEHPELSKRVDHVTQARYHKTLNDLHHGLAKGSPRISPETFTALDFSLKKLLFLFTDVEDFVDGPYIGALPEDKISEDSVHERTVAFLLTNLLAGVGCDIDELPAALDQYVYLASTLYLPRLADASASGIWKLFSRHDRFCAAYGALLHDTQRSRTVPAQRRRR